MHLGKYGLINSICDPLWTLAFYKPWAQRIMKCIAVSETLGKLVKWLSLLGNCSQPMHSCPINSLALPSPLWLTGCQHCSHDCPWIVRMRLSLPSYWLSGCTAAAALPLPFPSAVTGCSCVRAKPYKLRWSSAPYTAILCSQHSPYITGTYVIHQWRHTYDYVSMLLLQNCF